MQSSIQMNPPRSSEDSTPHPSAAALKLESRRRRTRQACVPCRSRKRKCDGHSPCKTCVEFEYQCFFRENPRKQERELAYKAGPSAGHGAGAAEIDVDHDSSKSDAETVESDHNPFKQRGIFDALKVRYASASSAIAFPRILGLELNRERAPRLHSFGWHLGIRAEPQIEHGDLRNILNWDEARDLSEVYWSVVHPAFGFLNRTTFEKHLFDRFRGRGDHRYDCILSGALALGSFFSGLHSHLKEQKLVMFCQTVLEHESLNCAPELHHAAAWILRVLYLRSASRPYAAWAASCTLMHLVEVTGLHRDIETVSIIYPAMPKLDSSDMDYRRRLTWLAKILNRLISYEFGRNEMVLEYTCHEPSEDSDFPHTLLQCAKLLPSDAQCPADGTKLTHLKQAMELMITVPARHDLHQIIKADLITCMFRRLWLLRSTLSLSDTRTFFEAGNILLASAKSLASMYHPWWSVLSAPFQYVCALIAMNTPESLAMLPTALVSLENVATTFNTHLSQEALDTAQLLITLSYERKASDMKILGSLIPQAQANFSATNGSSDGTAIAALPEIADSTFFAWPDDSLDWDSYRLPVDR